MAGSTIHNWQLYEAKCRSAELSWLRSRTPAEKLVLYEDLYGLGAALPASKAGRQRLEAMRWREKVAIRQKLTAAFAKSDQFHGE